MDIVLSLSTLPGRWKVPSNKSLLGSVTDKVLGRGRSRLVLTQVLRARVLMPCLATPELRRYATLNVSLGLSELEVS